MNSAEYGFPQRRKRVFIYAEREAGEWDLDARLTDGVMARALPIKEPERVSQVLVPDDAYVATQEFNVGGRVSPFEAAGAMQGFSCATARVAEDYHGPRWEYLKGSKHEPRVDKKTGHEYFYSEGAMAFPDLPENTSRTILTGEGGSGASRFKHIVRCESGRYRRLVPDELDQLQTFPRGWTDAGMTDGRRAFCMGNALVVGVPHLIGRVIANE